MTESKLKIIVAITGASGAIYAKLLLQQLIERKNQLTAVGIIMSDNAKEVWKVELDNEDYKNIESQGANFRFYDRKDFNAPFASGSALYTIMIICPCSMGTLGRIANGISDDLVTRAADVILKERRRLIVVPRETPYNLIHINNLKTLTEAGGIVCPASPSYYSRPQTVEETAGTVINRVLDLAGLRGGGYRWHEEE